MRLSPCWAGPRGAGKTQLALVLTAERDSLHREGADYARRLRAAGVFAELDVTPGADHSFLTEGPARARVTMARIAAAIT